MSIDIEAKLIEWLNKRLDVAAYADVPASRPEQFITVERTGGGRDNVIIDRPTVAIQCWSTSRASAADLAYVVDDALPEFTQEPGINKARRTTIYNFPDEKGNPRYQLVCELVTTF